MNVTARILVLLARKVLLIYLDTSTFSKKTRCNLGSNGYDSLVAVCCSNNQNQYSKPSALCESGRHMQSSFMAKRELKKDDWERRTSIRSGPFSFLGSGLFRFLKPEQVVS